MKKTSYFIFLLIAVAFVFGSCAVDFDAITGDEYEAEKAEWKWAIMEREHAGFSGEGYVNYDNEPDGWIEFTVNIAADGEYVLVFVYAHGADGNRPVRVEIDGAVVLEQLDFMSTGAWPIYLRQGFVTNMTAGEHKIKITCTGPEGGPNIDKLIIGTK